MPCQMVPTFTRHSYLLTIVSRMLARSVLDHQERTCQTVATSRQHYRINSLWEGWELEPVSPWLYMIRKCACVIPADVGGLSAYYVKRCQHFPNKKKCFCDVGVMFGLGHTWVILDPTSCQHLKSPPVNLTRQMLAPFDRRGLRWKNRQKLRPKGFLGSRYSLLL
jgi:hypothetical protein